MAVNLADAKAQLDASRTTMSSTSARASSADVSSRSLETAFAKRSASLDATEVKGTSTNVASVNDASQPAKKAESETSLVEINESTESRPVNSMMSSIEARRAAVDAALRELSRLREGVGHRHGRGIARKSQHLGKHSDQAIVDQPKRQQTKQDFVAGMILLRADGDAEFARSADRLPHGQPTIEAVIGAYRALDFGTDDAPAPMPAAPVPSMPKLGLEDLDAALSQRAQEAGDRTSTRVAGAALAAGAITMAVRHEVLSERKKRRLKSPR
jgi:hypothetical protein